ncbi:MAG: NAD+ synthase [Myxococcales bacterium]|nr:NAD+ synthase [Myxococcales bacterium]
MKFALCQQNITIGDFDGMERLYRTVWERARDGGASVLVLPELATTGYPPRDLLSYKRFVDRNLTLVHTMAQWTLNGPAIITGCVTPNYDNPGRDLFNSASLLDSGQVQATVHKTLLPTYDVFDEDRYFEPAPYRQIVLLRSVPIGLTICEDIWTSTEHWHKLRYITDPVDELVSLGARLLINLSASPFSLDKPPIRQHLISDKARKHGVPALYVNQVGAHDELVFDGNSMVFDSTGRVIRQLAAFQDDFCIVDLANTDTAHSVGGQPQLFSTRQCWEEQAVSAICLGIKDYVRKSGFDTVVLGLSGGIDSALTAVLASIALGPEHVWGIAMPTRFSSTHSVEDACILAQTLGIRFDVIPIEPTFAAIVDQLAPVFQHRPFDLAEENLQARLRGTTLMAVANKFGSLLLCTSNKSEAAVGYTTLYGDMTGALAPIADLYKTQVYAICRWLNRDREIIPARTIEKPPSAELRFDQKDEDSLPPYDVLDSILKPLIESPDDLDKLQPTWDAAVKTLVERVTLMVRRAEYKRRQAPPVLRISGKAFGVGRRMPVVWKTDSLLRGSAEIDN